MTIDSMDVLRGERMMKAILALAAAGALLLPVHADAQLRIGAGGGPIVPVGHVAQDTDTRLHGGLMLDLGLPLLPIGVRADAMYHHMPFSEDGNVSYLAGTLAVRLGVLPLLPTYLLVGGGVYGESYTDGNVNTSREWHFGANGGIGARLNLLVIQPMVEARLHVVLADTWRTFVPVTVGLFF
jgi:hypothetical protein